MPALYWQRLATETTTTCRIQEVWPSVRTWLRRVSSLVWVQIHHGQYQILVPYLNVIIARITRKFPFGFLFELITHFCMISRIFEYIVSIIKPTWFKISLLWPFYYFSAQTIISLSTFVLFYTASSLINRNATVTPRLPTGTAWLTPSASSSCC
jgi:hypothetical protein